MPGEGIFGVVDGHARRDRRRGFVAALIGSAVGPADGATFAVDGDGAAGCALRPPPAPGVEDAARRAGARGIDCCCCRATTARERRRWAPLFGARMRFRQSPDDKLAYRRRRSSGRAAAC